MAPRRTGIRTPAKKPEGAMAPSELSAVRFAAEIYYTNDIIECITIAQMHQMPQFNHIRRSTLDSWCAAGNWPARRREKQDRIRAGIEQRIGQQIMQQQLKQLDTLGQLYDRAIGHSLAVESGPKSWEGAAAVAIKASKHLTEVREQLAASLLPRTGSPDPEGATPSDDAVGKMLPDDVLPTMSDADARAVAHQLLLSGEAPEPTRAK